MTEEKITISVNAVDAIQRAGEDIVTAIEYAKENKLKIPRLADAALEISAALDIIYPRGDVGEREWNCFAKKLFIV